MFTSLENPAAHLRHLICLAASLIATSAPAITVEVAKKCDELTAKSLSAPRVEILRAGSAKGNRKQSGIISANAWQMVARWNDNADKPSQVIKSARAGRPRPLRRCF